MKISDLSSSGESLSALSDARERLSAEQFPALPALMQTHDGLRPHLDALLQHFAEARHPEHEFEQQIWQTAHDYLQQLDLAYAFHLHEQAAAPLPGLMHQALLQRLECLALLAIWHYLRYQALTEFFWRELHATFRMAEPIAAIAGAATARYLQVLMLDSVNRNNMTRPKIILVGSWLSRWCQDLTLAHDYDPKRHIFLVDLHVPRGARLIRQRMLGSDCRYWSVASLVARLQPMRQQLENGELPAAFPAKTSAQNALRLVEKLLAEWSPSGAHRERRADQRQNVMKYAQVVHGILNVCQHVKNMGFAPAQSVEMMAETPSTESNWLIDNESRFGFGTFVYADFNRWLEPGYLIAMNYDLNPDLAVVGIVRSIEQRSAHKYSVGIEVLSHTPGYVRLQQLSESGGSLERLPPFAALFLPQPDEQYTQGEREQPGTVVMPILDYVPAGLYELHTPQMEHVVQLSEVLEQQADWIRVAVSVAADIRL